MSSRHILTKERERGRSTESGSPTDCKVLIAEDDRAIAWLIAEVLEDLGYGVTTVYNGRDAISMIERDPPDLVISDVMMPYAGGEEVVRALRRREATHEIPVILVSAVKYPSIDDDNVTFISKPFNIDTITDAVNASLVRRSV